jgi:hypothetical protein
MADFPEVSQRLKPRIVFHPWAEAAGFPNSGALHEAQTIVDYVLKFEDSRHANP